jgi:hypothetical protein
MQLKGVLIPANDPDPPNECPLRKAESELMFYFDGPTLVSDGKQLIIIELIRPNEQNRVLLGIEREADGTATVTAHVVGKDGREVANVDKNTFEINRNAIFDSLSSPRPDPSTIRIKDSYGNQLIVRYLNKHTFSFNGKVFYSPPDGYVQIDDKGLTVEPNNIQTSGHGCVVLPAGGALLKVGVSGGAFLRIGVRP